MPAIRTRLTLLAATLLLVVACGLPALTPGRAEPSPTGPLREAAPRATRTPTELPQPTAALTPEDVADRFHALVDEERAKNGLPSLTLDPQLERLAQEYADSELSDAVLAGSDIRYLVTNSWWTSYHGASPRLDGETAAEQLAYCLSEERMREAILRPEARATGIGAAIVGDTMYFSQVVDVLATRGGNGETIVLWENDQAQDPDWETLLQFLAADDTDAQEYVEGAFVCGDFAEVLHNRAEEAGIRSAYVAVELGESPGHALNAFMVGEEPVFVDAIGGDKVACLEVGRPVGVMSLSAAEHWTCAQFDEYAQLVSDYLAQSDLYGRTVREYNREIGEYDASVQAYNRNASEGEYDRLREWSARLDEQAVQLDAWDGELRALGERLGLSETYWSPTGSLTGAADTAITDVYVHW